MALTPRVLPSRPVLGLAEYERAGGGQGLEAAARLGPDGVIDEITAAGLRCRGGGGFPTGRKWAAVSGNVSPVEPTTVVVNGAEGEPGSFKDRAIMRADPYRVLESALIAAFALSADTVIVAIKETFTAEAERLRRAIDEIHGARWATDVELSVFEGPPEYLYGEETGLLEAIDGRGPFPRVSPPYRHGAEELGSELVTSAAKIEMAAPGELSDAPPTLANNVETLANVPGILAQGAEWFRSVGTADSPGTIVCTVSGRTARHGVAEMPMGTPLRDVIDEIGGFIVFDDTTDFVAVAAGVSRFLSVESCGQCVPCKQDGLELAGILEKMCKDTANEADLIELDKRIGTVADSARCNLALQHQLVVGNIRQLFPDEARAHTHAAARPVEPELIAGIVDIEDGRAVLDERQRTKQPDWTFDSVYSGKWPATLFTQRSTEAFE